MAIRQGGDMPKCGKKAGEEVEKAMHERKKGTLKSGRSGKKVKSKKQAVAIGLSKARKAGAKVPRKKSSSKQDQKNKGPSLQGWDLLLHFIRYRLAGIAVKFLQTFVDFLAGFFPVVAITFLEFADHLLHAAVDLVKIVIGQLAPPFLGLAADLFPLTFKDIFIHGKSPFENLI
jgi:hypothetical protein